MRANLYQLATSITRRRCRSTSSWYVSFLASGLEIDPVNGGIVVNGQLEAVSGIYAAGACASYYDQVNVCPLRSLQREFGNIGIDHKPIPERRESHRRVPCTQGRTKPTTLPKS